MIRPPTRGGGLRRDDDLGDAAAYVLLAPAVFRFYAVLKELGHRYASARYDVDRVPTCWSVRARP